MAMKPYYDRDGIVIYHGDCLDVLPQLEAVDHVITDPPYSDYVHSKSKRGDNLDDGYSRSREFGFSAMTRDLRNHCSYQLSRLTRRWTLVFSDVESSGLWRDALVFATNEYVRTGAWIKVNCTPQFTGDRPAVGFEAITIVHPLGKKRWNGGGRPAVWEHTVLAGNGTIAREGGRFHSAQKPLSLMRELVTLFTDHGETILDPFMGSGTTLRAAKDLGRKAIGIEIEERYCEIAAKRLAQEVLL
jgi:DNA modification methylase